jgi:hypothetical protein
VSCGLGGRCWGPIRARRGPLAKDRTTLTNSAWFGSDSFQIGGPACVVSGSLFEWWVGCEAAVGGDVGEDLLDQGEHVGVLDGVDMVAPSRRALIRPARRSLLRCWLMVATPTTILMPRWWVSGRDTIA